MMAMGLNWTCKPSNWAIRIRTNAIWFKYAGHCRIDKMVKLKFSCEVKSFCFFTFTSLIQIPKTIVVVSFSHIRSLTKSPWLSLVTLNILVRLNDSGFVSPSNLDSLASFQSRVQILSPQDTVIHLTGRFFEVFGLKYVPFNTKFHFS